MSVVGGETSVETEIVPEATVDASEFDEDLDLLAELEQPVVTPVAWIAP
jgi:hypothetical protein